MCDPSSPLQYSSHDHTSSDTDCLLTMTSEPTEPPTEPPNETPTDLPTEVATTPASEPGFKHATQSSGLRRRVKHRVLQSSREPIDGV